VSEEYDPDEVAFVAETLAELQPDIIVEWGTGPGHSATMFHRLTSDLDCPIHSIEAATDDSIGLYAPKEGVTFHHGQGVQTALGLCIGKTRPLLYLDDDHVEQKVFDQLEEISLSLPRAVILLHDLTTQAMVAGKVTSIGHEPWFAVNRFRSAHPNYELRTSAGRMTMGRLWPR
jgi:cephalosporin hydroxylase